MRLSEHSSYDSPDDGRDGGGRNSRQDRSARVPKAPLLFPPVSAGLMARLATKGRSGASGMGLGALMVRLLWSLVGRHGRPTRSHDEKCYQSDN